MRAVTLRNDIRDAAIRRRAIASVKAQIIHVATNLHHRSVELEQLLHDQVAAEVRAEGRRDRFHWMTRGYRVA